MAYSGRGPSLGKTVSTGQLTTGESEVLRPFRTFRIRDTFDPKPQILRKPVPIRPPGPKPPPLREPGLVQNLSCEPETKPIMRRRALSLPPTTEQSSPRNTQVRFVDSLGLELEDVKFFQAAEDPSIPIHVISRLLMSSELASRKPLELSMPYFKPSFPEIPAAQPDFLERLCHQRVCLEQILCSEVGITGTVQVLNLAFEKEVTILYSFTDWKNCACSKATWVSTVHREGTCAPEFDVFRFRLPVPPFILEQGAILEFAICSRVGGTEYWDNNYGHNYKLACHSYKLTVPRECADSMVHFT